MNIKDIANIAGVSKATVSRVINNPSQVTPALRVKVQKVIEETGYEPNLLARELVTKETKLIGVILPQIGIDTFSLIAEGIIETLDEQGYNVLLSRARHDKNEEKKYLNIFKKKYVDGVVLFATHLSDALIEELNALKIPLVIINSFDSRLDKASIITYDDYNAAKSVVTSLIAKGHKHIGYIGLDHTGSDVNDQRKKGYRDGMVEAGLVVDDTMMVHGDFSIESGYEAMRSLMEDNDKKLTAVFTCIDRLAYGAMSYLREKGYNIPRDVAVMGIDNMDMSKIISPSLSSVDFNYKLSGIHSAQLILDKIKNPSGDCQHIIMDFRLIERESTL